MVAPKELVAHLVDDSLKSFRRCCLQGIEAGRAWAIASPQPWVIDADGAQILTAEDDAIDRDDGDEAAAVDEGFHVGNFDVVSARHLLRHMRPSFMITVFVVASFLSTGNHDLFSKCAKESRS